MGVIFYGLVVSSQTPQSAVRLITNPPSSKILPFEAEATAPQSPVQLTLQAVDAAGKHLENAKIHLQIFTPRKNPLFPTDFPIVEGTELLNIEAIAPKGELQIQQMLPIRGKYQLLVNVTPIVANAFTPIQQTLTLSVSENWVKYRNFGVLAVTLLMLGLVGGLVIGGQQQIQSGAIVPERVRLLLSGAIIIAIASLVIINISAEIAESHTHGHEHQSQTSAPAVQLSQGVDARIVGDVKATVGQPANLAVQVIDPKTNQPVTDVIFNIKATQAENKWVAFAYQGATDPKGQFIWKQQFFDGAPHQIEVEILPQPQAIRQFSPLLVKKEIEVEAVAPPLSIRLIALAYFTSFIVLGLVVGLQLKRKLIWQFRH
jgi:hypothetical protein